MPKESKLKNFSMYKFDGNEPAPTAGLETIEKMTYIFGLKLELGSKELELNISADNGGNIDNPCSVGYSYYAPYVYVFYLSKNEQWKRNEVQSNSVCPGRVRIY